MAVSWRISAFQKKGAWNPYFYSVFRVRAVWAKLSKKEILDTHPKRKNIFSDNWKAHFWVFLVFSCFFLFFFLCLFFLVCCFFLCFFLRATSLGPKPSLFVCFFCFFVAFCFLFGSFPFFVFNRKTLFFPFPLKGAFFGLFSVFLYLPPLTFFGLHLFCFSFSVSLLLLSFFIPSCLSSLAFF